MDEREMKQEASISVQSRVDIRTLANLSINWEESGVTVSSMSQLISWSLELLLDTMKKSGVLKKVVESVSEANQYLNIKGLYQKGLHERSRRKISNALEFENLRFEGIDPKTYVSRHYNTVHNRRSVDVPSVGRPFTGDPKTAEEVRKAVEVYKELEKEDRKKALAESRKRLDGLIDSGALAGQMIEDSTSTTAKSLTREEIRERAEKIEKEDEEYIKELKKAGPREDLVVKE